MTWYQILALIALIGVVGGYVYWKFVLSKPQGGGKPGGGRPGGGGGQRKSGIIK